MRTLISIPLLVFTTAALTAGVHTTAAPAQERIGALVITAPRYHAEPAGPPDFAPGTHVAFRERSNLGGGLFEFLATGRTGGRDTTLTRQPFDRPWQDAAPEYDRAPERYYGPQPYLLSRNDAPDVRETPARPAFDPRFAKQTVSSHHRRKAWHRRGRYPRPLSLSRAGKRQGDPIRRRCRPCRLHLVGHQDRLTEGRMARMDAAAGNVEAPPGPADLDDRRR
jgi:hypothetical protein